MPDKALDDQSLRTYVAVTLGIVSHFRTATGMSVAAEETLREQVVEKILDFSDRELLATARQCIALCNEYLGSDPGRGGFTLRVLEELLGDRYARSFLQNHPTIKPSDARQVFDCGKESAAEFASLLAPLQDVTPAGERFKLNSLIERLTGAKLT